MNWMGEYAEMILDGECCQICGEYLGESMGHPMTCASCHSEDMERELESEIERGGKA